MSKSLEALERLYDNVHRNSQYYETGLCNVDFKIIEKELKRLEWYDNLGKPTSGILPKKQDYRLNQLLNCFEYIKEENIRSLCQKRYEEIIDVIDENETNKKALEIIKPFINDLIGCNVYDRDFAEYFIKTKHGRKYISKEEYDLLKEVLL